jgi:hypothetical protein
MHHGANTRVKDADGWTIIDEAAEKQNGLLMGVVFDFMYEERRQLWHKNKCLAIESLKAIPDFYVEMNWQFDSSVIPLVSRIAPHDTCKLWKIGSNLRLDTTIVGWKRLRCKRRPMSLVFRDITDIPDTPGNAHHRQMDLVILNHSK